MGTVTGYTAERMKAIEDASVVNGELDAFGHLILTRFDESTIDAGLVVTSPKIIPNAAARPIAPEVYAGMVVYEQDTKLFWSYTGTGWTPHGGVFHCTAATRPAAPIAGMEIYETDTKRRYIYTGTAWSYLFGGTPPSYFAATSAANQNMNVNDWTVITLGNETDYGGNFAASAYTVPETGLYSLSATASIQCANNPQNASLGIAKGGVDIWEMRGSGIAARGLVSGDTWGFVISTEIPLVAGDVLTLRFHNGGAAVCVAIGGFCRFTGRRI